MDIGSDREREHETVAGLHPIGLAVVVLEEFGFLAAAGGEVEAFVKHDDHQFFLVLFTESGVVIVDEGWSPVGGQCVVEAFH